MTAARYGAMEARFACGSLRRCCATGGDMT
jgi:hypothetical protein